MSTSSIRRDLELDVAGRAVFRGVGQVFFQENAWSGLAMVVGLALGSPRMAVGAVIGSAIGLATALALKFDREETAAGIYGFNAALVGISTLFFFQTGGAIGGRFIFGWSDAAALLLLVVGCVASTLLTRWMRTRWPFPTYTTPFIVTAWVVFLLGQAISLPRVAPLAPAPQGFLSAVANGIGQVMFQAGFWPGLLFLIGIALNNRKHAAWVLAGSIVGMLMGSHHATATMRALDPERLVNRTLLDNVALGLYGYNATLAAVALSLARRSLIAPFLGMLISVVFTELIPLLGIPALTAPFVLATWVVLALGCLEDQFLKGRAGAV